MPIFLNHIEEYQKAAIWKIEEPESFFEYNLGLKAIGKLPEKRLEYLASRFLLKVLKPDFPIHEILIKENGKPYLEHNPIHFSISHSYPYVGVVISKQSVGIDVQVYREKITRLQEKFLSLDEQEKFNNDYKELTLAWSAKEAVFKWSGIPGINFKENMPISQYTLSHPKAFMQINFQKANMQEKVNISGSLEEDFAWMLTHYKK